MQYLIGYDIRDEKRLQRIYRRMTKFATPIQYSLFLFHGSKKQLNEGIDKILAILNKKEDDLRIYPLPENSKFWQLGKNIMPDGIMWGALPNAI